MVADVMRSPVTGERTRRSKIMAIALLVVAAVVLSTATVLGARWASQPSSASQPQGNGLGFVRLDRPAPAVALPGLTGHGMVSIASLAGRPVVLNFWASSCHPCTKETPALAAAAAQLHGKVSFIGIDTSDNHVAAARFIARYQVSYPIGFDPQATMANRYGVEGLPTTFFLAPSGKKILGVNIGALTPSALRSILRRLYGIS